MRHLLRMVNDQGRITLPFRSYRFRSQQIGGLGGMDQFNVFVPPELQRAHDRRDLGVSECADRAARNVFAQIGQGFKVFLRPRLSTMRRSVWTSQELPSRQGLHFPQDS